MQNAQHQNLVGFIWNIANKLRGPYRPPQYRRVMLPLIILRRFDLVLAENKQKVLDEKKRLEDKGITGHALEKALSRIASTHHKQELFNTSGFTFEKLLGEVLAPITDFPKHLPLPDQGRFALGYYHQRQDFFTKKTDDNASTNTPSSEGPAA